MMMGESGRLSWDSEHGLGYLHGTYCRPTPFFDKTLKPEGVPHIPISWGRKRLLCRAEKVESRSHFMRQAAE